VDPGRRCKGVLADCKGGSCGEEDPGMREDEKADVDGGTHRRALTAK